MPSVVGLLEERERAARQRMEVLRAELREAEVTWERFVITRQTVAEVLAEPPAGEEPLSVGVAGERPARVAGAVPGPVVPAWREGLDLVSLAPDHRRLVEVLAGSGRRWTVGGSLRHSVWRWSRRRWRECGRRSSAWPRGAG